MGADIWQKPTSRSGSRRPSDADRHFRQHVIASSRVVCTQGRLVINQYYTGKRPTNLPSNLDRDLTNEADAFGMGATPP